jgi:hypothetical protein
LDFSDVRRFGPDSLAAGHPASCPHPPIYTTAHPGGSQKRIGKSDVPTPGLT